MGSVGCLITATKSVGYANSESTKDLVGSVNDFPVVSCSFCLCKCCFHQIFWEIEENEEKLTSRQSFNYPSLVLGLKLT